MSHLQMKKVQVFGIGQLPFSYKHVKWHHGLITCNLHGGSQTMGHIYHVDVVHSF